MLSAATALSVASAVQRIERRADAEDTRGPAHDSSELAPITGRTAETLVLRPLRRRHVCRHLVDERHSLETGDIAQTFGETLHSFSVAPRLHSHDENAGDPPLHDPTSTLRGEGPPKLPTGRHVTQLKAQRSASVDLHLAGNATRPRPDHEERGPPAPLCSVGGGGTGACLPQSTNGSSTRQRAA